jgi:hypothetical protein
MDDTTISSQSETSPLTDRFSLDDIINGLAADLVAVRNGRMTIDAARAQAELAKQIFNGVRLVVTAQKFIERRALPIGGNAEDPVA